MEDELWKKAPGVTVGRRRRRDELCEICCLRGWRREGAIRRGRTAAACLEQRRENREAHRIALVAGDRGVAVRSDEGGQYGNFLNLKERIRKGM
ncbi:hypothetical protein PIB30_089021 [Stylosanthes scabra]|uniref:Uncharacterized protein n=1 Tax=Stylosanthes scabra TaxID=79078 RepID=A0ABU6SU70_9FABA|nr:hypothetical protein [Stylosanthes scabra]